MYQRENYIHEAISNQPLISCAKIAESVKTPPCIPYYEAYTYALVARYFDLTEKRVYNAYVSHRNWFHDDCVSVQGNQMLHYVRDVKSLGQSYGHLCEFTNGVVVQISYGANMLFSSRALLHFAIIFKDESDVAKQIYDIFDKNLPFGYELGYGLDKRRKIPWFAEFKTEPLHAVDKADVSTSVVCPYLATMSEENKLRDEKPMKIQTKDNRSGMRRVNQLDKDGNIIYEWNSLTEAANTLGIDTSSIYRCCTGKQKTAGATQKGAEGKYRFCYVE